MKKDQTNFIENLLKTKSNHVKSVVSVLFGCVDFFGIENVGFFNKENNFIRR